MALGPKEALTLTDDDKNAVTLLEEYIDRSPEMHVFDGGEVKVTIPETLATKCLSQRFHVRFGTLRDLYLKAGWKQVHMMGYNKNNRTITFNQHEPRTSSGKD